MRHIENPKKPKNRLPLLNTECTNVCLTDTFKEKRRRYRHTTNRTANILLKTLSTSID
jgi:hypothetical protein